MESNYVIAICTNSHNRRKLEEAIGSRLVVNENQPSAAADYTASVIDDYVFTSTVESINGGKIKCDVYVGNGQPRLHLNYLEMVPNDHPATLLLAGELDSVDLDVIKFSSYLINQISSELKKYSPLGRAYASLLYRISDEPFHRYDFQIGSSCKVMEPKKSKTPMQLASAQKVIEEWMTRNGMQ